MVRKNGRDRGEDAYGEDAYGEDAYGEDDYNIWYTGRGRQGEFPFGNSKNLRDCLHLEPQFSILFI